MSFLQKHFLPPITPRVQWNKFHMLVLKNPIKYEDKYLLI